MLTYSASTRSRGLFDTIVGNAIIDSLSLNTTSEGIIYNMQEQIYVINLI